MTGGALSLGRGRFSASPNLRPAAREGAGVRMEGVHGCAAEPIPLLVLCIVDDVC